MSETFKKCRKLNFERMGTEQIGPPKINFRTCAKFIGDVILQPIILSSPRSYNASKIMPPD